jgi:hypothetical protein
VAVSFIGGGKTPIYSLDKKFQWLYQAIPMGK